MPDRLEDALTAAEEDIAAAVSEALTEVAAEFTAALNAADELVAARFSVARISRMWSQRVPRLVRRLLGVAETAANRSAEDVDAPLPDDWDNLPGRHEDGRNLPASLGDYAERTEHLLRAIGDRLSDVAARELAAGLDAGEDMEQLRARLRAVFAREGAQLGDAREERIARTEAARAWNTATLAAGRDLAAPDRPLVKQWLTRRDTRVRDAHATMNGQLRLLDEPFNLGGVRMSAPSDPTAPPELVINCRCVLALARAERTAAYESKAPQRGDAFDAEETGMDPSPPTVTAASGPHTGAMIALMPAEEDAARLALDSGQPAGQLHLTLYYLGEGEDFDDTARASIIDTLTEAARDNLTGPIRARLFGANHWNGNGNSPCWVWAVGDESPEDRTADAALLHHAHEQAVYTIRNAEGIDTENLPVQYTPWAPHIAAAYSDDPGLLPELQDRLGKVAFNRLRVAFAGEYTDIPLGPQEEAPMEDQPGDMTAAAMPARTWSTPGDTAIAFENQETGDGRVFSPGSLYWDGGPWPLQYADEMLMGHEGAELAGAIQRIGRDGDRITASGVLYPGRPAGADAVMLLEEGAPLGISVDLDDVDVEFVDRTTSEDKDGILALAASLPSVSVLRLEDGSLFVTANTLPEWSASGVALSRSRHSVQFITGPGGAICAAAVRTAFAGTGVLTAAAGDTDDPETGVVVHSESSGDLLLRITRARVRGATLVSMPAYDRARIVLDDAPEEPEEDAAPVAAAAPGPDHHRVVSYVSASPVPVGAREVAQALGMSMVVARGHLTRATNAGRIVRLARGQYVGASTLPEGMDVAAALSGDTSLPVHDNRDAEWDRDTLRDRAEDLYARLADAYDDPALRPPWEDEEEPMGDLEASAWTAMRDTDPMPAAWFREPTEEELPPGSGGVHYADGRIYGWVAQAGEPHAGYPGRNLTVESLGDIDLTHFLRAKFRLDDGSLVRAGAFTMNAPHHRDGAECESAACQFDDTRTVAGIVTVGMNSRGLWFSGAAAPWLSEWDRNVFAACQPSYHMKQGPAGRWQLRAVLSVPVPGHSSPLLASAVAERSNLALAASASGLLTSPDTTPGHATDVSGQPVSGQAADTSGQPAAASDASALAAALVASPTFLDGLLTALDRREAERAEAARAEVQRLAAAVAPAREEIAASMAGTTRDGDA
ncbi:phage minor head protein [Streptomyces halobius]|uniref:Phage head morphogenesis domain-containing protein n=1 Tax=Streptomyces halobius TaxID=2879846 RepID=A0ABY4MD69_9ACTN|nr:phage minor head protein [Streptomyces halobius]UQA95625.1 hypothetical protein K9S39_30555 [Streptomyces halobius]